MTRINIIPPEQLFDQHLIAEYRETLMVVAALKRSIRAKGEEKVLQEIPPTFRLNKGHVKFFYNKLQYLEKRFMKLVNEMKLRGFNPNDCRVEKVVNALRSFDERFYRDWEPEEGDEDIIKERIREKWEAQPSFYRKTPQTNE